MPKRVFLTGRSTFDTGPGGACPARQVRTLETPMPRPVRLSAATVQGCTIPSYDQPSLL